MNSPAPAINPSNLMHALDTPKTSHIPRPQPINLQNITVTPQRWDSQPSPGPSQASAKRKANSPVRDGMPTPKTPYGAHYTPNPTPRSRKYYKQLAMNMPKQELSQLERKQMEEWNNFRPEDSAIHKAKLEKDAATEALLNSTVG